MSTYAASTGVTIQEAFQKFHAANPEVFLLIVKEADRAVRKGKKKFSVKQIIGYLRWEIYLETKEDTLFESRGEIKKYKIGDQYTSRYSRLLLDKYPRFKEYIEQRDLRAI